MMPTLTVTQILPLHSCKHPKLNKLFSSPLQRNSVLKTTFTLQRTLSLGSFLHSLLCVSCRLTNAVSDLHEKVHKWLGWNWVGDFVPCSSPKLRRPDCCRKAAIAGVLNESSGTFRRLLVNSLFCFLLLHDCHRFGAGSHLRKKRTMNTDTAQCTHMHIHTGMLGLCPLQRSLQCRDAFQKFIFKCVFKLNSIYVGAEMLKDIRR